jgi:two-component system OmpR family sensor kinase
MSASSQEAYTHERQDRLLAMLERLLELPASATHFMFDQAVQQIQEVLAADLVAFFFHDPATDTLVAWHCSDTPLGRKLRTSGMNRLPLANGGSAVSVFLTGVPFLTGQASQTPCELPGIITGLGVKSQMAVVFRVQTYHRGVTLAASVEPDFFSPDDLHFLEAVARWIGQAIGRNELVEQMENAGQDQKRTEEELLTIMVHELRNYLQPLRGRLDLLMERAKREGRQKDMRDAESSMHTLQLLSRGIGDAVDVARLNQGVFSITPVSMNLNAVVQDVVDTFAAKDIPLAVRSPAEIMVTADPQRIHQAVETMLRYLLNASSKLAEITVDVSTERRADGFWALLCVTSVGLARPTIPESYLHSFVTSSHSTQLGVQLYLTNQIALAHHGTFTVDSINAQACRLILAFPVEEEELIVRDEDE